MKSFRLVLICTVLMLFVAVAAQAQTATQPIRVHVPFAFQVANAQFPAGDYSIYLTADRMHIVNVATGQRGIFVKVSAVRNSQNLPASLQFALRNGNYTLSKVWTAGLESGADLGLIN